VKSLSLQIGQVEVVGLLGPNGAGKTTTFYMLVGLVSPDKGRVFLKGEDITELPMHMRAKRQLIYLPQEPSVFRKLTVEENLLIVIERLGLNKKEQTQRLESLLAELNMGHLAKQKAFTLSGGERRKLEILRSLILTPLFMLLDEPFAGIDPLSVLELQRIILDLKKRGIGVLITDHNVFETLRVCDRAYIIDNGQILISGTPEEILQSRLAREAYLGPLPDLVKLKSVSQTPQDPS
jgi:lipopolysaccharide export system ATP-binding protein